MTVDPENRPALKDFPTWLEKQWDGDMRELRRGRYLHHQSDLLTAFNRSPFWKKTVESLPDCSSSYERDQGFILFKDQRVVPPLFEKPWESFLSRCWRTNVRNNGAWPDPPEGGWLLPDNWFERSQDILRTRLVVRYLDGVEWLDRWLRKVAEETGAMIRGPRVAHAGEWGYYAMHVVITQAFEAETIDYEDYETRSSGIEIQPTDPAGGTESESSFALVYVAPDGSGVGSAIVLDGRTVRGASGGAGEVGHIVVQPGGPRCNCGNRGCLQALVSGATLRRRVAWGARAAVDTLADAAQLVENGDELAAKAFVLAGRSFGQGLAAIVNLVNPPRLLLGAAEYLLAGAPAGTSPGLFRVGYEECLRACSFSCLDEGCAIEIVELNQYVAAHGAAHLAARREFGWAARPG